MNFKKTMQRKKKLDTDDHAVFHLQEMSRKGKLIHTIEIGEVGRRSGYGLPLGTGFSFGADRNVLKLDGTDGCATLQTP